MKWTLFYGILFILSVSLCGCVGSPCGPCGPYGYNSYSQYGACFDECGSCDPCGTACPPMNYAYGGCASPCGTPYCGLPGSPIRTVGCGAVQVAATPVSWLVQILRGTNYPCHGCGDERYWGDYGYVPGDFCSPCTYDGQWAGNDQAYGGCGGNYTVCQQGLSYRHPAVGTYMNQMYAPVFQDKIASTHAKTPLDYGLRGDDFCGGGCDPCGCNTCYTDSCSTGCDTGCDIGCSTGCDTGCDTGYISGNGTRVSPGYAPPRQQPYYFSNATSNVSTASYRTAKPSSPIANKVYPPVKSR